MVREAAVREAAVREAAVRVAAVQVSVDDAEEPLERRERVVSWLTDELGADEWGGSRADLVVLPELWGPGAFNLARVRGGAEPLDGPFTQAMADLAVRLGAVLHAGSFPEIHDGGLSNTSVVFAPDGALLAVYRKIHLFGFDTGEVAELTGGEAHEVVQTGLGATGLATCYDLRFPELFRHLTDAGAHAFLIPAGWPAARIRHWEVLATARAIENQGVVVACNAVGTAGGVTTGGTSLVLSATGDELARGSADREEILIVDVDPTVVTRWREEFPALRDRRLR